MPLALVADAPTLFIRKEAFERAQLTRAAIDQWLNLTDEEFRVEGVLLAIGPIYDADALQALVNALEDKGLEYFDDFFELPGNWPAWLHLHAMGARG
ncbi:MAG: hypothetical protein KF709_07155 [Gemmatimonadaceae bacterium]|nr:hypothetical protein [Gemmatimonadaceae bacterium]